MSTNVDELVKRHLKASKKLSKELAGSKEKSRKFLIKAGLITKTGKLTKPYR
jgi:hypothetical protein